MLFNAFLCTFLVIFIATSALTLASLPGWIRIPDSFRNKLFAALILQVIGCVIAFVSAGIQTDRTWLARQFKDNILEQHTWKWHYAPMNWETKANFKHRSDGKWDFTATTTYHRWTDGQDINEPLMTWQNVSPFSLPDTSKIEFDAVETVLPISKKLYGVRGADPGQRKVHVRLDGSMALAGSYFDLPTPDQPVAYSGGMALVPSE